MDQSQKQKEQAREPRSIPIGTAIGRKLAAAGVAEKRARQLGNMMEGLKGHLAENSMIARLDVSDLLPMFALMLGSMMAEVAEYQAQSPQWAAIVDLEDVRQLIDIPRMPDPDPAGAVAHGDAARHCPCWPL